MQGLGTKSIHAWLALINLICWGWRAQVRRQPTDARLDACAWIAEQLGSQVNHSQYRGLADTDSSLASAESPQPSRCWECTCKHHSKTEWCGSSEEHQGCIVSGQGTQLRIRLPRHGMTDFGSVFDDNPDQKVLASAVSSRLTKAFRSA